MITSNTIKLEVFPNIPPVIYSLTRENFTFDDVAVGSTNSQVIVELIDNNGPNDLVITGASIVGNSEKQFAVIMNYPVTVQSGFRRDVTIEFSPASAGLKNARLVFQTNAQRNDTLNLSGNGTTDPLLFENISLSLDTLDLALAPKESIREGEVTIYNNNSTSISIADTFEVTENAGSVTDGVQVINVFRFGNSKKISNFPVVIPGKDSIFIRYIYYSFNDALYSVNVTAEIQEFPSDSLAFTVIANTSSTVSVVEVQDINLRITATPNPSNGDVWLTVESPSSHSKVGMRIVNMLGATIMELPFKSLIAEKQSWHWDGHLQSGAIAPAGTYRAVVEVGGRNISIPILIVR
jgi:hypothetical protein